MWVENDHYTSLSASLSLEAEPLPVPDSSNLPDDLVETVTKNSHLFRIVTKLRVDRLEAYLRNHPNRPLVEWVLDGIKHGFYPRVEGDFATHPSNYDGSRRIGRQEEALAFEQCIEEVKAGRYSEPFDNLLPGMHVLPQCVINKNNKPRVVMDNTSGPYAPNSILPRKQYSVKGDKFEDFLRTLCQASLVHNKELTLFKSDVSKAYRILPMHPYWQVRQVLKIQGQYYIDRCNSFGCRASGYIFVVFYSLVMWVAENNRGIQHLYAYIDDNFSYDLKDNMAEYKPYGICLPKKQVDLLTLWDDLEIPHEIKKQEYGQKLDIIGHTVNIQTSRVLMPDKTKSKILEAMSRFSETGERSISYGECQTLVGLIGWAATFLPHSQIVASSLREMMSGIKSNAPKTCLLELNEDIVKEFDWLAAHIRNWEGYPLYKMISSRALAVHCEATPIGIGFYCAYNNRGYYEQVPPDVQHVEDAYVFAIVQAIKWACSVRPHRECIRILCSSCVVTKMFQTYRPTKVEYNKFLMYVADVIMERNIDLQVSSDTTRGPDLEIACLLASNRLSKIKSISPHFKLVSQRKRGTESSTR